MLAEMLTEGQRQSTFACGARNRDTGGLER